MNESLAYIVYISSDWQGCSNPVIGNALFSLMSVAPPWRPLVRWYEYKGAATSLL